MDSVDVYAAAKAVTKYHYKEIGNYDQNKAAFTTLIDKFKDEDINPENLLHYDEHLFATGNNGHNKHFDIASAVLQVSSDGENGLDCLDDEGIEQILKVIDYQRDKLNKNKIFILNYFAKPNLSLVDNNFKSIIQCIAEQMESRALEKAQPFNKEDFLRKAFDLAHEIDDEDIGLDDDDVNLMNAKIRSLVQYNIGSTTKTNSINNIGKK